MSAEIQTGNDNTHACCECDCGTRRDFMQLAAAAFGAVGLGFFVKPVIDSLRPAKDTQALATVEVDIGSVPEGESMTVMWRGKPVFIRHRTRKEIEMAQAVDVQSLTDKQSDEERVKKGKEQWLVTVGVCTHLGCIPQGQKPTDNRGGYDGWFCSCHGSEYDTSGRIRKGPAPKNLDVPPYEFVNDTTIKIG
ncbi:MAG: ubiquinol-cytochrome c reductase iron-sulfur subunit [Alphaproteobacteria bacterium]|nr:ubiquinol-cytochrome c reductase iron-sulfur subunit [Alphaproteobacteria bacterium]